MTSLALTPNRYTEPLGEATPRAAREVEGTVPPAQPMSDDAETTQQITQLLADWRGGDAAARDRLLEVMYDQLRRLAVGQLRRHRARMSLQPTELVHEAFLKLDGRAPYKDRGHFMALCATAMRHILIDAAKHRFAQKRGGGQADVTLEEALLPDRKDVDRVLAVGQALDRLRQIDERLVQVVECRFFTGLTESETAEALGVSARTINRDWARARAWLARTLGDEPESAAGDA